MIALPLLSPDQIHEIERLLGEVYQISPRQRMENAGHQLALLAKRWLDNDMVDRPLVVLAGRGKKGGCGLVAARYLLAWGAWAQVVLTHPPEVYAGLPAQQLAALQALDAPLAWAEEGWELPPTDLVIDALVGSGLHGEPAGKVRDLMQLANSSAASILSLDAPSGLDPTTGQLATPHVQAAATLLLTLPSSHLISEAGSNACGKLYLAASGVPSQLYARLGLALPPLLARDSIVPLDVVEGMVMISDE
ncbi:MAG: NAD(P)H-hydrate epimerase [Caldilineaceae bacterium]